MAGSVFDDFDIGDISVPEPVSFSYQNTPEYRKEQREKRFRQYKKERREQAKNGPPKDWFDPNSYNPNTYRSRRKQ